MNREEALRLLDSKIALAETELAILRLKEEREWRTRFAELFAQRLYLIENWPECRACRKWTLNIEACLESRLKTGKCVLAGGS